MSKVLVNLSNFSLKYGSKIVLSDVDWMVKKDENWLLIGASGSGKSALLKAIAGIEHRNDDLVVVYDKQSKLKPLCQYVAQWYQFKNKEGVANFYYQQRYNVQQVQDTLSVQAELTHFAKENQLSLEGVKPLIQAFDFERLQNNQLIELSSGEHKKLQLIKALWLKPQILLLDQPYTGLDVNSRQNLNDILDELASEGVQIILVSNEEELPTCINRFAELKDGHLIEHFTYCSKQKPEIIQKPLPEILKNVPKPSSSLIAKMVNVNIRYGEKEVLRDVNWEVKAGEKWLLYGPNGSGKSTLLSLINGDHPQAYANELYLFGNKRGSGESIWDIKKNIGLISPELHWYFDFKATVWQSIASGYFDSIGLYKEISFHKRQQIDELIEYFDLSAHKNELLGELPLGKQRLVLLARTVIKNPELLVLDEPCQGMDSHQTLQFNSLIDSLCHENRTLIYVSHNQAQIPKRLTHQLMLNQGEVVLCEAYQKQEELENIM